MRAVANQRVATQLRHETDQRWPSCGKSSKRVPHRGPKQEKERRRGKSFAPQSCGRLGMRLRSSRLSRRPMCKRGNRRLRSKSGARKRLTAVAACAWSKQWCCSPWVPTVSLVSLLFCLRERPCCQSVTLGAGVELLNRQGVSLRARHAFVEFAQRRKRDE